MQINKLISKYNHNSGSTNRIKYIVIHYVGAVGDAKASAEYFTKGNRNASAHYFVGYNGEIWQSVEDANIAWHCGAKKYNHPECRNSNSIGIEMCTKTTGNPKVADANWYFEDATVTAAIELTKELMKKYGVSPDHVIRHYDVTGKDCPAPYVHNTGKHTWDEFKKAISGESVTLTQATPVEVKPAEPVKAATGTISSFSEKKATAAVKGAEYKVKVETPYLNIRKGPGTNFAKTGSYTGVGIFTIVETKDGWGKLKAGNGWIYLKYAKRI